MSEQLKFATGEVAEGANVLSVMAKMELPEEILEDNDDRTIVMRYTPIGVVTAIVPWNFPILLGTFMQLASFLLLTRYVTNREKPLEKLQQLL